MKKKYSNEVIKIIKYFRLSLNSTSGVARKIFNSKTLAILNKFIVSSIFFEMRSENLAIYPGYATELNFIKE